MNLTDTTLQRADRHLFYERMLLMAIGYTSMHIFHSSFMGQNIIRLTPIFHFFVTKVQAVLMIWMHNVLDLLRSDISM